MEFLGIGPLELLVILLVALLVLGPRDIAKTGKTVGKTMRKVVTSPQWRTINQTSREIRNIPTRLMREAGLDEVQEDLNELNHTARNFQQAWTANSILPPRWPEAGEKNTPSLDDQPGPPANTPPTASESSSLAPTPTSDSDLSAWLRPPE